MEVVLYDALLQSNDSTAEHELSPDGQHRNRRSCAFADRSLGRAERFAWPHRMQAALLAGERFTRLYTNGARQGTVQAIDLHVETIPRRVQVELEARPADFKRYGTRRRHSQVEATIRPWQQPARNVRIPITLPAQAGRGKSAPSRLGCRYAGQDAESAAVHRPAARSRLGAGTVRAACMRPIAFM